MGAKPGMVSILHTNGQDFSFLPHVHCILSVGGMLPSAVEEQPGEFLVKEKGSNGNYISL